MSNEIKEAENEKQIILNEEKIEGKNEEKEEHKNEEKNEEKEEENEAVSKIQSAYKGHNLRKLFNKNKTKTKLINKIILKLLKATDPNNKLQAALAKWMKNARKQLCHENARTIQKFCKDVRQKILNLKNKQDLDNYKNLANVINNIKVSPKEFFDKLKQIRRNQKLNDILEEVYSADQNSSITIHRDDDTIFQITN